MKTTQISVVIPTYNGKHLLEKHLPSVLAMLEPGDEVVIADDQSTDQTVEWLSERFALTQKELPLPEKDEIKMLTGKHQNITVTVVANYRNQRFGETANRGVVASRHPYILLLNNDVKPTKGVREALLKYFNQNDVFAVGCLEQEMGSQSQTVWGGKNRLWFEKGMFMHSRAATFESGPTAWVSGGSGMFSKEKWLALNGFDKVFYPAYWEDIDLSFRARKKGWQVLFAEEAKVEHHHETTNSQVFGQQKIHQMSWKNAVTFVWKNGTISQKCLHVFWKPYWWWQQLKVYLS